MRDDRSIPEDTVWYFCQDAQGRWHWSAVALDGAVVVHSAERFPSRSRSEQDAMTYGYAANDGCIGRAVNPA